MSNIYFFVKLLDYFCQVINFRFTSSLWHSDLPMLFYSTFSTFISSSWDTCFFRYNINNSIFFDIICLILNWEWDMDEMIVVVVVLGLVCANSICLNFALFLSIFYNSISSSIFWKLFNWLLFQVLNLLQSKLLYFPHIHRF
jgi:hypothetical protein